MRKNAYTYTQENVKRHGSYGQGCLEWNSLSVLRGANFGSLVPMPPGQLCYRWARTDVANIGLQHYIFYQLGAGPAEGQWYVQHDGVLLGPDENTAIVTAWLLTGE